MHVPVDDATVGGWYAARKWPSKGRGRNEAANSRNAPGNGTLEIMAATVNVNGRLFDQEHAVVSVFDHGFLYGEGVYET